MNAFIGIANSYDPWYIVRSKPKMETYVAQTLKDNLGLVVFLPQGKVITPQDECKSVPFFPGYLFIQAAPQSLQPQRINSCPGVLYLITFGEKLAFIPHTITETIHKRISDFNRENQFLNRPFQIHDPVRLKEESSQKLNMISLNDEIPEGRLLNILDQLKEVQVDPCHLADFPEKVRFTRGKRRKTMLHSDFRKK